MAKGEEFLGGVATGADAVAAVALALGATEGVAGVSLQAAAISTTISAMADPRQPSTTTAQCYGAGRDELVVVSEAC